MRKILLSAVSAICLFSAENIASGAAIKPVKDFAPPPPITPNIALSAMPENQFDHADRSKYYFVTNKLDNSTDPFHLSAGFYGRSFYSSALYKYRGANFYTILNAHYTKANNYEDGGGDKIKGVNSKEGFGYKRYGQNFVVGYLPNDISELRATFIHDRIDDDKQPQHLMDAVKTDRYVTKFNARIGDAALGNTLNLEAAYRDVKREANNFLLRNSAQKAYVKLERKILDLGAGYDYDAGALHNVLGVKFTRDRHDGKRYTLQGANFVHTGNRFPKIDANIYQIYDTISYKFNDFHKISFGLDYVFDESKTKSFEDRFAMGLGRINNRMLWRQIYGRDFSGEVEQKELSGALKYDFTPNEKDAYTLALESLARIPNNMERFNALYGPLDNGWISNPFLEPERHNRARAEFKFGSEAYKSYLNSMYDENSFALNGYLIADHANDLVIYDRRHSRLPAPMNKNAVITRNVDARLFLANLGGEVNFARNFGAKLNLFYSYGQNRTDGRPLYQMHPFEANLNFDYKDYAGFGSFNAGAAIRYVAKQTRGDWDKNRGFGIDLKEGAKSFTTMDLYGGVEFKNKVGVRLGVNNVFDRKYAEFISGAHVGALSPTLVNAPGREFWLSVHASF